jgi:hypothetical protein
MSRKFSTATVFLAGASVMLSLGLGTASQLQRSDRQRLTDYELSLLVGTACDGGTAAQNCSCGTGSCQSSGGVACDTTSTTCVKLGMGHCHKIKQARSVFRCNDPEEGFNCTVSFTTEEGQKGCYDYYKKAILLGQECDLGGGSDRCGNDPDSDCGTPVGECETTPQ